MSWNSRVKTQKDISYPIIHLRPSHPSVVPIAFFNSHHSQKPSAKSLRPDSFCFDARTDPRDELTPETDPRDGTDPAADPVTLLGTAPDRCHARSVSQPRTQCGFGSLHIHYRYLAKFLAKSKIDLWLAIFHALSLDPMSRHYKWSRIPQIPNVSRFGGFSLLHPTDSRYWIDPFRL